MIKNLGCKVHGLRFKFTVKGVEFRVQVLGSRVQDSGFRG
jgi:hypothetical protein